VLKVLKLAVPYIVVGSSKPLKLCTRKLNISRTSDTRMLGLCLWQGEKKPVKGHGNTVDGFS
jgi:hypothetical protein